MSINVLFTKEGIYIPSEIIKEEITSFGYKDTVGKIIYKSKTLDQQGEVFFECAGLVLSNFGMTRGGPFKKGQVKPKLLTCWDQIGSNLMNIKKLVNESGLPRERFLLELDPTSREVLIAGMWSITKKLLPITMGKTSWGLVGASKILFSIFPEIVLPVDNVQWREVFQTVDLGDVIRRMTSEIESWEKATGNKLNELDDSGKLATLPAVYNVMAMAARPKRID